MAHKPDQDVGALIQAACLGRQEAFAALIDLFEDLVMRIAVTMTGRAVDAQDVGQEVFLRFFRSIHRIDPDQGVAAWLRKVTIRVCLDVLKRRERSPAGEAEPLDRLEAPSDRNDHGGDLQVALGYLTQRERHAFLLIYQFGYSTAEAGEILGCTSGTVKTLCFRARGKLRKALQKESIS